MEGRGEQSVHCREVVHSSIIGGSTVCRSIFILSFCVLVYIHTQQPDDARPAGGGQTGGQTGAGAPRTQGAATGTGVSAS